MAADLAVILEHSDPSMMAKGIDDDWKGTSNVCTPGGTQSLLVIWEPGIYQLLSKSRKPQAKPFQKWLFEEVVPTIRKTGGYRTPEQHKALPQRDIVEYVKAAESLESLPNSVLKSLLKDAFVDELELQRTNARALPPGDRKQYTIVKVRAKQLGYTETDIKSGTGLGRFVRTQVEPEFQEMVGRYPVYHYEITPELDTAIHTYFGAP